MWIWGGVVGPLVWAMGVAVGCDGGGPELPRTLGCARRCGGRSLVWGLGGMPMYLSLGRKKTSDAKLGRLQTWSGYLGDRVLMVRLIWFALSIF